MKNKRTTILTIKTETRKGNVIKVETEKNFWFEANYTGGGQQIESKHFDFGSEAVVFVSDWVTGLDRELQAQFTL